MAKQPRRLIQERLRALANIVEESETFDQTDIFSECSTPGCVAGHAVAWLLPEVFRKCAGSARPVYVMNRAQKLLELDDEQAEALFDAHPYEDCGCKGDDYDDSLDAGPATACEAAAVLRRLADTGEVDWYRIRREDPARELSRTAIV